MVGFSPPPHQSCFYRKEIWKPSTLQRCLRKKIISFSWSEAAFFLPGYPRPSRVGEQILVFGAAECWKGRRNQSIRGEQITLHYNAQCIGPTFFTEGTNVLLPDGLILRNNAGQISFSKQIPVGTWEGVQLKDKLKVQWCRSWNYWIIEHIFSWITQKRAV